MERPLIEANPQVEVFGAYYREHVMLARDRDRDRDRGPVPESLAALKGKPVAVSGPSLAGWCWLAPRAACCAKACRPSMPTAWPRPGRSPRAGWVVGCAVKRGSTDLAQAIQPSLTEMTTGPALREMFGRHGVTWRS